jgi:hypothetical protein
MLLIGLEKHLRYSAYGGLIRLLTYTCWQPACPRRKSIALKRIRRWSVISAARSTYHDLASSTPFGNLVLGVTPLFALKCITGVVSDGTYECLVKISMWVGDTVKATPLYFSMWARTIFLCFCRADSNIISYRSTSWLATSLCVLVGFSLSTFVQYIYY